MSGDGKSPFLLLILDSQVGSNPHEKGSSSTNLKLNGG